MYTFTVTQQKVCIIRQKKKCDVLATVYIVEYTMHSYITKCSQNEYKLLRSTYTPHALLLLLLLLLEFSSGLLHILDNNHNVSCCVIVYLIHILFAYENFPTKLRHFGKW